MKRVILDVDVGTDDAVALMLLLWADAKKLIKLEAITCTNGNTKVENVVTNVLRLLEAAERTDIPVFKGAHEPLIIPEQSPSLFHGEDGFGDLIHEAEPNTSIVQKEIAAMALGKIITKSPGEVSLVALGPLSNLALAIKLFPTFSKDLKELWIMGGNYKAIGNITRTAEFNFFIDPEAAHIVLQKIKSPISIVTWETTMEPNITMAWRYDILGAIENPLCELITRAEKKVYHELKDWDKWCPCDAYVAASFIEPLKMVTKHLSYHGTVELHGWKTRGQVVLDHLRTEDDNLIIIESLNEEYFKQMLIKAASMKSYKP